MSAFASIADCVARPFAVIKGETEGTTMKLDTNRAWESGTRFVRGNASLLAVIAGLFMFLPSAVISLLYPQPATTGEMEPEEIFAALQAYFAEAWLLMLIVGVISTIGSLAIYRMASVRDARTVGETLKDGLRYLLPYLGVALLLAIGFALIGVLAVLVVALFVAVLGQTAGAVAGILVALAAIPVTLWIAMRTSLAAPVVMAEDVTNPIAALKRSFALTKGNSLRILVFVILLAIAAIVVVGVLQAIFGLIFTAAVGGEAAVALTVIFSAVISTIVSVIFIAVFAAIYRQLASAPTSAAGVPTTADE